MNYNYVMSLLKRKTSEELSMNLSLSGMQIMLHLLATSNCKC